MIQLPSDVVSVGYDKSPFNQFEFDQIFHSDKYKFTGSERDFLAAGLAYEYVEIDKFTHRIINDSRKGLEK